MGEEHIKIQLTRSINKEACQRKVPVEEPRTVLEVLVLLAFFFDRLLR